MEQQQRDHDLLIEINTKLTLFFDMFKDHKKEVDIEINDLKREMGDLREAMAGSEGFWSKNKVAVGSGAVGLGALVTSLIQMLERL